MRQPALWMASCYGRERLLYQKLLKSEYRDHWQDLFPGKLITYKKHIGTTDIIGDGVSFIAFHGKPRPHEVYSNIMIEHWR